MPTPESALALGGPVAALVQQRCADLIAFRRDLHAHPELAWTEERSTACVADRLDAGGVVVKVVP
jgi:amidohydrolase